MTLPAAGCPLDWSHETIDIPERGLKHQRAATEAERLELASALGLLSCEALEATYQISPKAAGSWQLTGGIDAAVTQACVISLEPLTSRVAETFTVEFRREPAVEGGDEEIEILASPDVEPLHGDTIDVGRIVYETLSAGLDPYPRKEGAEFGWTDPKTRAEGSGNPFAVLKKLKDQG